MKIPSMPQKGGSVEHAVREIINFIRASRITSVRGGLLRESPNGTTIQIDSVAARSGINLDAFYAVRFSSVGEPVITSAWVVCYRGGMVKKILTATIINDTTVSIDDTETEWPKVDDITAVECGIGLRDTYTGTGGGVLEVSCTIANYDRPIA